ncbi:MAG TPA: phosphoadenylyl-sulfate reductase [Candidatus Acidoferrum sp.]|nr:phosphoadenylyl-sulfate reductase [Candidatus Acidoferrum sp.]
MIDLSQAEAVESLNADEVIARALGDNQLSRACLTCSFQAEDVVVLHLLRMRVPQIPVLFLETGYHFPATYEFRDQLAREWRLNLLNIFPHKTVLEQEAELGILYQSNPTRCCQLRKVEPLMQALEPFEIWFTGLRREQSPTRRNLKKIEEHRLPSGKMLFKVNPLADWTGAQVWGYTGAHRLPFLPQYDRGYSSIGCEPCTALPSDPNSPRSGRWGGRKLECGIHTFSEQER